MHTRDNVRQTCELTTGMTDREHTLMSLQVHSLEVLVWGLTVYSHGPAAHPPCGRETGVEGTWAAGADAWLVLCAQVERWLAIQVSSVLGGSQCSEILPPALLVAREDAASMTCCLHRGLPPAQGLRDQACGGRPGAADPVPIPAQGHQPLRRACLQPGGLRIHDP